ncbi:glycoside hydrolase family 5 protein [Nibricoccus sp. IMCC34717]|uniref:glycoside hydrolase family 5 protein n=1 Tax=Nibricoccus sp. IMCC34717 TaxID=3034021 RepID=UPI00384E5F55
MTRRTFLVSTTAAAVAASLPSSLHAAQATPAHALARKLPRWRGFNLLEKFIAAWSNLPFVEKDFIWMAEWGFDFARLPMSYRCWSSPENWRKSDERVLKEIDEAVEFGRKHGVHISLNFHRAPGYSVDRSIDEPFNLWTDAEALDACAHHWAMFAKRYQGIPSTQLSFDLVNEPAARSWKPPADLDDATYAKVVRALVQAIRSEDPNRLILAEGLMWGNAPVPALADLGIAQSTRGYSPHDITHWKADWVGGSDKWPVPTWPKAPSEEEAKAFSGYLASSMKSMPDNPIVQKRFPEIMQSPAWDRQRLALGMQLWKDVEALGVGVHVGEFGVYNKTPHRVTLALLEDYLSLWKENGWGWALWNLRGDFGILDSGRSDVAYEDFRGHKLDRAMLELLRKY